MLHECCVSAALHAAWSSRGTHVFYVLFTFCSHQRASALGVQTEFHTVYPITLSMYNFQAFLSIEDDTDQPEESVFYQVQSLFGHLMESKLQYYIPENFWKVTDSWALSLSLSYEETEQSADSVCCAAHFT